MMERYLDDIEYFYKGENPKWNYPEECPLGSNIRLSMMRCLIAQQGFQELGNSILTIRNCLVKLSLGDIVRAI